MCVCEHLGFVPARGMQFVFSSRSSHLETIPGSLLSPSLPNYTFFFFKYRQDTIINISEEGRQERRDIEKHKGWQLLRVVLGSSERLRQTVPGSSLTYQVRVAEAGVEWEGQG